MSTRLKIMTEKISVGTVNRTLSYTPVQSRQPTCGKEYSLAEWTIVTVFRAWSISSNVRTNTECFGLWCKRLLQSFHLLTVSAKAKAKILYYFKHFTKVQQARMIFRQYYDEQRYHGCISKTGLMGRKYTL